MRRALPEYDNYLPHYLERLSGIVSDIAAPAYEARNLSATEWRIMARLSSQGRMPQKDIAPAIGVEKVVAWRAVTGLRKKRFIGREFCAGDSRAYEVFLTEAGHAKFHETVPSALHRAASLMPGLSYEDLMQLMHLLKRLEGPSEGVGVAETFIPTQSATAA